MGVADGLKAWEIMQERRFAFDLVLTEVVMPSLSGIGLLTKVISTEECKNIPVISKFTYQLNSRKRKRKIIYQVYLILLNIQS